jgi:hypothetical protein
VTGGLATAWSLIHTGGAFNLLFSPLICGHFKDRHQTAKRTVNNELEGKWKEEVVAYVFEDSRLLDSRRRNMQVLRQNIWSVGPRLKSGTRQMPSRIDTIRLGDSVILQNRKFNINNKQICKSSEKESVVIRSVVYDVLNSRNTFVLRVSKFILLRLPEPEDQGTILLECRKLPTQRHVGLHSPVALLLKPQTPQCSGNVSFEYFILWLSFNDAVSCWHYKASVTEDFMCMEH